MYARYMQYRKVNQTMHASNKTQHVTLKCKAKLSTVTGRVATPGDRPTHSRRAHNRSIALARWRQHTLFLGSTPFTTATTRPTNSFIVYCNHSSCMYKHK